LGSPPANPWIQVSLFNICTAAANNRFDIRWARVQRGRVPMIPPHCAPWAPRHLDYGVTGEDYETVGRALIATLAELGPRFTPETRDAGIAVYDLVASVMQEPSIQCMCPRQHGSGYSTFPPAWVVNIAGVRSILALAGR